MLNAGIIGLGVGAQHAKAIAAVPGCRVAWLCDLDAEKLSAIGAEHPGACLTLDAEDVLADGTVDFVVIASYDNMHASQAVTALDSGKHVLLEKPICQTEDELARIADALARNPRAVFQANLVLRRSPRLRALKSSIVAGNLGELYFLEADYAYGRVHKILESWRGEIPFYSVMGGGGIHVIDTILWLTGCAVLEVHGYGSRIATQGTKFRYDDFQVALLHMENGLIAKVSANFACVYPHNHLFAVYGTKGTFVQNVLGAASVTTRDPAVAPEMITISHDVAKGAFIPRIIQAIRGEAEAEMSRQEILDSMRVCLAIERAIKQKRTVQLENLGSAVCQQKRSLSASP